MSNFIKKYWEDNAIKYETSCEASWKDNFAIELEISNISKYIEKDSVVLDAGCGNGYSTFRQLKKKPKRIIGVDFAKNMITFANKRKAELDLGDEILFEEGNIKKLRFDDETFDTAYTTRVLINLPKWTEQVQSIDECIRVTKKGGIIIFSEAFWEPFVLLNSLRTLKQLPPLTEHNFNRYIKKRDLENYLNTLKLKFEVIDFCSIYYLGSRFLRELVTNPYDYPGYTNQINEIFYKIEKEYSGGGFGIQLAYVIKK
ncbi:MAG TPA: class I SAM-dependent methyltransferase [Candidatus Humimicrobiaceae bacterium]